MAIRALSHRVDWSRVLILASKGGIAGLVSASLEAMGWEAVPRDIVRRFLGAQLATGMINGLLLQQTAQLCGEARRRGLLLVPLKGAALLMGRPYTQADLRTMADIDLLVDRPRFGQVERLMTGLGYTPEGRRRLSVRHTHHVQLVATKGGQQVLLELHWTPYFRRFGSPAQDAAALARLVPHTHGGVALSMLDPEDTLLSVLCHMAGHRYQGSLKWAVDVVSLLDHFESSLRWDLFWQRAARLGAVRPVAQGLWLSTSLLHDGERSHPFSAPGGLRGWLLRRLCPVSALVDLRGHAFRRWQMAVLEMILRDGLLQGMQGLLFKVSELVEREQGMTLPRILVRGSGPWSV